MDLLFSIAISGVLFFIIRLLNGLVDYLEGESGFLNSSISIDSESISIFSQETFYSNLSRFIFDSKRKEICHSRKDLITFPARNVRFYEKFLRTKNPNLIRNGLIEFCTWNSTRSLVKCSSLIILSNLNLKEQDTLCKSEVIRLEGMNFKINSRRLILDKKIVEIVGINQKRLPQWPY